MTTWNKELCLYIDADAPEGAPCLLNGKFSLLKSESLYFLQGDKLSIKLFFRRRADSSLSASTAIELPVGANVVFAAKSSAEMDSNKLLFSCIDFAEEGAGDNICYTGLLDMNTLEIAALFAAITPTLAAIKVDIEIQNVGNTERTTFQFDAVLKQQVYGGEANPNPGTPVYPLPQDLVLKRQDGSFVRFDGAEENLYLYHPGTNKFYPLVLKEVDGVIVVAPGEGVDP